MRLSGKVSVVTLAALLATGGAHARPLSDLLDSGLSEQTIKLPKPVIFNPGTRRPNN
ncbi:MAG: hypothetical protein AB3N23_14220 [Paracoccaceae bacterium]